MKLLAKFNLLRIVIFGSGWGITEITPIALSHEMCGWKCTPGGIDDGSRHRHRNYTSNDIKPLLESGT